MLQKMYDYAIYNHSEIMSTTAWELFFTAIMVLAITLMVTVAIILIFLDNYHMREKAERAQMMRDFQALAERIIKEGRVNELDNNEGD